MNANLDFLKAKTMSAYLDHTFAIADPELLPTVQKSGYLDEALESNYKSRDNLFDSGCVGQQRFGRFE